MAYDATNRVRKVSIVDRKDDLVAYGELLDTSKENTEDRLAYIDELKKKQKGIEKSIIEINKQRSLYLYKKGVLVENQTPDVTSPEHPSNIGAKEPRDNITGEDHIEIQNLNPTDSSKSDAENKIRQTVTSDQELREINYRLSKLRLAEQRISILIKKAIVQEKNSYLARNKNIIEYNELIERISDLNNLIGLIMDIMNILSVIPPDYCYDEEATKYTSSFNDKTFRYATKRKAVIDVSQSFQQDNPRYDTTKLTDYFINELPDQYTNVINIKEKVTDQLEFFILSLKKIKDSTKQELIILTNADKDCPNDKVRLLRDKVNDHISNKGIEQYLDKKTTQETVIEEVNKYREEFDQKVRNFSELLKKAGDFSRLPTNTLENSFNKYLASRSTYLGMKPRDKKISSREYMENFWREKVRKKYGGSIPFEDEVQLSDGKFVKKTEAIEVSPGVYRSKLDVGNDTSIDKLLENDPEMRV